MRIWIIQALLTAICLASCSNQQSKENKVNEETTETTEISMNPSNKSSKKTILFFGDSITAGYQLEEEDAFPSLIQTKIDSLGLDYTVVNAGLSGETSAGGVGRIDWVLKQEVDIFLLELGANDALRGLDPDATKTNLENILYKVKETYPQIKIVLLGMQAPPNLGGDYTAKFNEIYPSLVKEHKTGFVPFLLDGVAGLIDLNLQDGIHPNKKGHKVLADNVWKELSKYL